MSEFILPGIREGKEMILGLIPENSTLTALVNVYRGWQLLGFNLQWVG